MRFVIVALVGLVVLLMPSEAYAWGPFTHLLCAKELLTHAALLPPALRDLLLVNAADFYYGSVAADIVVGKNLAPHVSHAHNWRNVLRLLTSAESPRERAFAFGYLSHLAGDVVAHNTYIPFKLVESFPAKFLRHTYWEARFDQGTYPEVAQLHQEMLTKRFPEDDKLHERVIAGTIFNFRTNKKIFDRVIVLQGVDRWQRALGTIERRSNWILNDKERRELLELTIQQMRAFLWKLEDSPLIQLDPRGKDAIKAAMQMRRELKRLRRRGIIHDDQACLVGRFYWPHFYQAASSPLELPRVSEAVEWLEQRDEEALSNGTVVPPRRAPMFRRVVEAVKNGTRHRG